MRIEDFPRPRDDNGRGVHWSARLYHDAVYPSQDHWVDQLRAMKIKWVKLLDDGGGSGIPLAQRLLAADIMPVIRIYMAPVSYTHLDVYKRQPSCCSRLPAWASPCSSASSRQARAPLSCCRS